MLFPNGMAVQQHVLIQPYIENKTSPLHSRGAITLSHQLNCIQPNVAWNKPGLKALLWQCKPLSLRIVPEMISMGLLTISPKWCVTDA